MRTTIWVLAFCGVGWAQNEKQLTAREAFYTPPPRPAAVKPAAVKPRPAPARPHAVPQPNPPSSTAPDVPIVPVATRYPLGLRYSILKVGSTGAQEVDAETVFRPGDRIRVSVEANDDGYLYIVSRGSSGAWSVLFPSAEIAGGDNRIERGRRYEIPSGYSFAFDHTPGDERLFVVLSRQPERDIDRLIYSLGRPPAPEANAPKVLLAQNRLDDGLVGRLRNVYSRDLIIEKVDETTAGARAEKAVYTVNPSGAADSRVVADITLRKQP